MSLPRPVKPGACRALLSQPCPVQQGACRALMNQARSAFMGQPCLGQGCCAGGTPAFYGPAMPTHEQGMQGFHEQAMPSLCSNDTRLSYIRHTPALYVSALLSRTQGTPALHEPAMPPSCLEQQGFPVEGTHASHGPVRPSYVSGVQGFHGSTMPQTRSITGHARPTFMRHPCHHAHACTRRTRLFSWTQHDGLSCIAAAAAAAAGLCCQCSCHARGHYRWQQSCLTAE
eukprot:1162131-Pelagomonas_calceolata.AAC.9